MKRYLIVFFLLLSGVSSYAQKDSVCSSQNEVGNYGFGWKKTILPASLVTVGAVAVAPNSFREMSQNITNGILGWRGSRIVVDDYVQYVPLAGAMFLDFAGVKVRHRFWDRAFVSGTSCVALCVLTMLPKHFVDEKRPQFPSHNSFPSGHTATAFMGAELVRIEYGGWSGAVAYAMASAVGVLRMYNGRHWMNDVIAGAGVGILSARLGEWSAPVWQRLLPNAGNRRDKVDVSFLPAVSPQNGGTVATNMVIRW